MTAWTTGRLYRLRGRASQETDSLRSPRRDAVWERKTTSLYHGVITGGFKKHSDITLRDIPLLSYYDFQILCYFVYILHSFHQIRFFLTRLFKTLLNAITSHLSNSPQKKSKNPRELQCARARKPEREETTCLGGQPNEISENGEGKKLRKSCSWADNIYIHIARNFHFVR